MSGLRSHVRKACRDKAARRAPASRGKLCRLHSLKSSKSNGVPLESRDSNQNACDLASWRTKQCSSTCRVLVQECVGTFNSCSCSRVTRRAVLREKVRALLGVATPPLMLVELDVGWMCALRKYTSLLSGKSPDNPRVFLSLKTDQIFVYVPSPRVLHRVSETQGAQIWHQFHVRVGRERPHGGLLEAERVVREG